MRHRRNISRRIYGNKRLARRDASEWNGGFASLFVFVPREIAEELRDGITLALIVAKGVRSVAGRGPEIKTTGDE